jgi:hypothetical protein
VNVVVQGGDEGGVFVNDMQAFHAWSVLAVKGYIGNSGSSPGSPASRSA